MLTEQPAEMGLIVESAGDGQLTERHIAGDHETACPVQASLDHIEVRRLAETSPESAREMRYAEANRTAEIRDMDRLRQMLFDERLVKSGSSSNAPAGREARCTL
jgi:hypothetical protein